LRSRAASALLPTYDTTEETEMRQDTARRAAAGLCLLAPALTTLAADFKAGAWDLSVGGFINAYYTHSSCSGAQTFTGSGLALASQALGCGGNEKSTVIGNGLLPNALITTAKTQQSGWDIGATLMIGAAVSSSDSISNNNNVDVRQGFMTFGRPDLGTFKLGRDYGSFGRNAILTDMTLLGAGATVAATQRNRVSLGHIGAGYTYLGHYGQMAYTTPSMGGLTASLALMSPVDAFTGVAQADDTPQVQAQLQFEAAGVKAWAGAKAQKFKDEGEGFDMNGLEIGASGSFAGFGLLANLQSGKGIGVLADADSGALKQTNLLLQGTYQLTPALKLGLGHGRSRIKDGTGTDLRDNTNLTGGAYYKLTESLTLVGELSRTESRSFAGDKAKLNGAAFGAILFF
jgi:predicted porin